MLFLYLLGFVSLSQTNHANYYKWSSYSLYVLAAHKRSLIFFKWNFICKTTVHITPSPSIMITLIFNTKQYLFFPMKWWCRYFALYAMSPLHHSRIVSLTHKKVQTKKEIWGYICQLIVNHKLGKIPFNVVLVQYFV